MSSASGTSSLPPLVSPSDGSPLSASAAALLLSGRRVALYFSAGWCPMCTSFEPDLHAFLTDAATAARPAALIYVGSDRSAEESLRRARDLGCAAAVRHGADADAAKRRWGVWAGSERGELGHGRRSGVPALVVLDASGEELAFVAAEADGARALDAWPRDDVRGIWGA
mmetsp:Transcript_20349/g.40637  ORF Transcript_20349/g.40637 Transcript_20349/m.40637 type:complete len:169 (-) Transcript_20349:34-540(-)